MITWGFTIWSVGRIAVTGLDWGNEGIVIRRIVRLFRIQRILIGLFRGRLGFNLLGIDLIRMILIGFLTVIWILINPWQKLIVIVPKWK